MTLQPTLRYRIEKGDEWWHVLDTHAGEWSQTVDRHSSEAGASESCRAFNEGTHPLVDEIRLSAEEWRAVVRMMQAVGTFIETCGYPTLDEPTLPPMVTAYDATEKLRTRMGW